MVELQLWCLLFIIVCWWSINYVKPFTRHSEPLFIQHALVPLCFSPCDGALSCRHPYSYLHSCLVLAPLLLFIHLVSGLLLVLSLFLFHSLYSTSLKSFCFSFSSTLSLFFKMFLSLSFSCASICLHYCPCLFASPTRWYQNQMRQLPHSGLYERLDDFILYLALCITDKIFKCCFFLRIRWLALSWPEHSRHPLPHPKSLLYLESDISLLGWSEPGKA